MPMGVGMPTCTSTCCIPDAITFAGKTQDEVFAAALPQKPHMGGALNLAVGVPDELEAQDMKKNMIVFRNDRAPTEMGGTALSDRIASAGTQNRFSPRAVDSCTMLNDLDFLATPEWQTMPQPTTSAIEEKLLKEAESVSQETAYPVALRALWHNCPDALEVALRRVEGLALSEVQARDKRFMGQKLEFTRIRQRFVALCIEFRSSGSPTEGSKARLREGVEAVEERCLTLMAVQPDEQVTQLPGLIQKRDTIMLQSRIRTITAQLLPGWVTTC